MSPGRIIIVTGVMASGKSTVAELLASRLPRSVHLRGDLFRRMVVNGRVEMSADASSEALRQLELRYDLTALAADRYAAAGFDVVVQDVIIGPVLPAFVGRIRTAARFLVVLAPDVDTIEQRERDRPKTGYVGFTPDVLDRVLREETPQIGYWLDSSGQAPAETVDAILGALPAARV